jgi:WD40 repeat protein
VIPDSPYKGLVPFEDSELDALLFFGRERESAIIGENLLAARLTVLYGPSGVGKTSVLRAGVAHRLRAQARRNVEERGHPEFVVVVFDAWSEDPVGSLRTEVREAFAAQFGSALLDEREGEPLADTFGRWTDALACDLLLILDQAEEYFLYHQAETGFAMELPELVTRPALRVRVLLSLRDDALAKLDRFKGEIPNLFANYLRLDHLDRRSAAEAVVKPVERFNELSGQSIVVEPELTEAVLDETAAGQVDLGATGRGLAADDPSAGRIEAAYLQLVLERIWEEERAKGSTRLRAGTLVALGGAESIVRAHLRRAVEELTSEERDVAADVFRFLVTPSGAKVAHGVGDLAEYASIDEQRLMPVLSTLGRERIVRTVDGAGEDGARYEIFHDVLGEAVLVWRREQELERERRAAERRHRRLAVIAAAALLALAAMTAVAIYAFSQRSESRKSARSARNSAQSAHARELIARAQSELSTDPLRSVALALQAAKLEPTPASEDALRTALVSSRVRRIFRPGRGAVNAAAYSPDGSLVVTGSTNGTARIFRVRSGAQVAVLRHKGSVTAASFSADGKLVVTASRDGTARLWEPGGRLLRTFLHRAPVLDAVLSPNSNALVTIAGDATVREWSRSRRWIPLVFHEPKPARMITISADSRRAAVVGGDRYARVYDLAAGRLLFPLEHPALVLSAAFGPSSESLVTGSSDNLARTWNLHTLSVTHELKYHASRVVDVAVGPNGQFVATASSDGTGAVWKQGLLTATLTLHTNPVTDIAFSRNGQYVITSSQDESARVWTTRHGVPQAVLAGHGGSVRGASFSPTGADVLTFAEDGTARIWRSGTAPELGILGRHRGPVETLDVTRTLAVTAGHDGTARIWRLVGGHVEVLRHHGSVNDASFSRDGSEVITASNDRTARIWTASGSPVRTLPHPAEVITATFAPDSSIVATSAADRRVRIWTTESQRPRAIPSQPSVVRRLAFSPDGKWLATGADDGAVRLWTTDDGERVWKATGHRGPIVALSFSPDGKMLLSGSEDGTARLWDASTGKVKFELLGHTDAVTSARFSADGQLVVTASRDHYVRLWDAHTGMPRRRLTGHFGIVSDARFSDDGRWLVTAGPQSAGLWQIPSGRLLFLLRGHFTPIRAAAFARGSHRVVTGGVDGTVRTYLCSVCVGVEGLEKLATARRAEVAGRH